LPSLFATSLCAAHYSPRPRASQRYPIPAGVNPKAYSSMVIWCEQFSVPISPADLALQSNGGQ
jgi:hypothetical protein